MGKLLPALLLALVAARPMAFAEVPPPSTPVAPATALQPVVPEPVASAPSPPPDNRWRIGRSLVWTAVALIIAATPGFVLSGVLLAQPLGADSVIVWGPAIGVASIEALSSSVLGLVGAGLWATAGQPHASAGQSPPPAEARAPPEPERTRHVGLHVAAVSGLAIDLEAGPFYGFAGLGLLPALASHGELYGFAVGAGGSARISRRWRFDLFALVAPLVSQQIRDVTAVYVGIGIGVGFHYTSAGGFTFGIKMPVIGAAPNNYHGQDAFGYFYAASGLTLPLVSFGYRL